MKYILMADIVQSHKKQSPKLMQQFKALVAVINKKHKQQFLSPLTITLGDEFQGLPATLKDALEIIIEIEEIIVLKKFDFKLRYVLNKGKIDTPINSKIAYEMLGEGLTQARYQLNELKTEKRIRFFIDIKKKRENALFTNSFVIFQSILDEWKMADAELINEFLQEDNYRKVAENLGKDISLVWKREKSLKMREYKAVKFLIHNIVTEKQPK